MKKITKVAPMLVLASCLVSGGVMAQGGQVEDGLAAPISGDQTGVIHGGIVVDRVKLEKFLNDNPVAVTKYVKTQSGKTMMVKSISISKLPREAKNKLAELVSSAMSDNFTAGSNNLSVADTNEKAANLLALQIKQRLVLDNNAALSFTNQSQQSVLQLVN